MSLCGSISGKFRTIQLFASTLPDFSTDKLHPALLMRFGGLQTIDITQFFNAQKCMAEKGCLKAVKNRGFWPEKRAACVLISVFLTAFCCQNRIKCHPFMRFFEHHCHAALDLRPPLPYVQASCWHSTDVSANRGLGGLLAFNFFPNETNSL